METKLKQEPVADGGGLQPLDAGKEARKLVAERMWLLNSMEQQLADKMWGVPQPGSFSDAAFDVIANLIAAYASSQEALRAAREENERLKRTVNLVAGGAAQGMMLHSKITNAYLAGKRESENYFEERMQQAVDLLSNMDPTHQLWKVSKAISLLSPEGSSR